MLLRRTLAVLIVALYYFRSDVLAQYLSYKRKYHSFGQMTKVLHSLAKEYPNRAHLYSIGKSVEGRELWVLAIANQTANMHVPLRPEVSLIGNMHGDEAVGKEMLLYLAAYMLEFYDYDPLVKEIMDSMRVHIMPSMNPDGFALSIEGTCEDSILGRGNARKVDLNRNFPDLWESNDVEREPETKAIMDWLEKVPFVLTANFHGGALVANYPYDNQKDGLIGYSETPDDKLLIQLATTYAKHNLAMYSGKQCGDAFETFENGIVNGADWYPVVGSLQDYQYGFKDIMAVTLEISCCKYPPAGTLMDYWQENRFSMLQFMKQGNMGVRGIIINSQTGEGVKAVIRVERRKFKITSSSTGEYFRILLPGVYRFQVEGLLEQYEPKHITFLVLPNRPAELNISLTPISSNSSKVGIQKSSLLKFHSKSTPSPKYNKIQVNVTTTGSKVTTASTTASSTVSTSGKLPIFRPIIEEYDNTIPNSVATTPPSLKNAGFTVPTKQNSLEWFVTEVAPSIFINQHFRVSTTKFSTSSSAAPQFWTKPQKENANANYENNNYDIIAQGATTPGSIDEITTFSGTLPSSTVSISQNETQYYSNSKQPVTTASSYTSNMNIDLESITTATNPNILYESKSTLASDTTASLNAVFDYEKELNIAETTVDSDSTSNLNIVIDTENQLDAVSNYETALEPVTTANLNIVFDSDFLSPSTTPITIFESDVKEPVGAAILNTGNQYEAKPDSVTTSNPNIVLESETSTKERFGFERDTFVGSIIFPAETTTFGNGKNIDYEKSDFYGATPNRFPHKYSTKITSNYPKPFTTIDLHIQNDYEIVNRVNRNVINKYLLYLLCAVLAFLGILEY